MIAKRNPFLLVAGSSSFVAALLHLACIAGGADWNDGILWFRESPSATAEFQDLAGNLAEFVADEAGKVFVIGASALSPPTRPSDQPFELGADQYATGFSDVGLRLAFSEPIRSLDALRETALGNWYLSR